MSADARSYAIRYAALGMSVFPLTGKKPMLSEEEGGHGYKDATTDPALIHSWFDTYAKRITGIGLPTGNGNFVLDVDPRSHGDASLDALISKYGPLPNTRQAQTGDGGTHLWFRAPEGMIIPNSASNLGPGLDIRGDGGYVVAPPSLHPDTHKEYFWDTSAEVAFGLESIADAPEWLIRLILEGVAKKRRKKTNGHPAAGPQVVEGQRNTFLFKHASMLRGQGHGEDYIIAALIDLNNQVCHPPLPQIEVERTARSASQYRPNRLDLQPLLSVPEAPDLVNGFLPYDVGNAQRLLTIYGQDFRFDKESQHWMVWDGVRWVLGDETMPGSLALWMGIEYLKQASNLPVETADEQAQKEKEELVKRAMVMQQAKGISSAVSTVKKMPECWASVSEYDRDPYLLNCRNGTIDLATGQIRPHQRGDKITHVLDIDYDPKAKSPVFHKFLFECMGGTPDASESINDRAEAMVRYLLRIFGYAITGLTNLKSVFLLYGITNTGKTTLLTCMERVLGSYATSISIEALLSGAQNRSSTFEEQMFRLRGRRVAIASEPDANATISAQRIKALVHGQPKMIQATPKYRSTVEFPETHKLFIDTNFKPNFRDTGDEIWNRLRVIEFPHQVPDDQLDLGLPDKLFEERAGIIAACVRGFLDYQQNGLGEPEELVRLKTEMRKEIHPLREFIDERCALFMERPDGDIFDEKHYRAGMTELKNAYETWCEQSKRKPLALHQFKLALRDMKVYEGRTRTGTRFYSGLRLLEQAELNRRKAENEVLDD